VANTTIGQWVEQFGSKAGGEPADESDELKQLREENRQLRMERDILTSERVNPRSQKIAFLWAMDGRALPACCRCPPRWQPSKC
jgi:transposase-like protein